MEGRFVAYYRVSTAKQGMSGLGLDAQRKSVLDYLNGGEWRLLKEFTEIETGKGANAIQKRAVLDEAIKFTKKNRAKLLIARLDRLARNVHFIASLMEAKIQFVAADMPDANEFTIHVMAALAQYESKLISERTKAALAQAKLRGKKLGNPSIGTLNLQRYDSANVFAEQLRPTVTAFVHSGLSQREMVTALNHSKVPTAHGGQWHLRTVQLLLERLNIKKIDKRGRDGPT